MDSTIINRTKIMIVEFALGYHDLSFVREHLSGYIEIDFEGYPPTRIIRNNQLEDYIDISFEKIYMVNNLQRYLDGKCSSKELSDWAAFIDMSGFFDPKGNTEAERFIEGEGPLWDILQKLETPEISGGLNPDVVKRFLEVLQ
jgi:hypothetical protein